MLKAKSLKRALAPIAAISDETCNEIARPAGDLDVIDMGVVADHKLERGVDLIVAAAGLVALDQHDARALLDHDQRAGEHRGRLVAGRGKHQMDRPLDRRALGDVDDRAVAHQRGVERDHALVARPARPCRDVGDQRDRPPPAPRAIERMVRPGDRSARSDSSGTNAPSTNTMRRASMSPISCAGVLGARLGGGVGRRRRAASPRASARADRCISTPRRAGAAGRARRSARTRPRAAPRPCRRPAAWPCAAA